MRFWVGRSGGSGGAGRIGDILFKEPKEYETDDPEMIDKLLKSKVARVIESEQPPDANDKQEIQLDQLTMPKLREMCKLHGVSTHGIKALLIERLEYKLEDISYI